MCMPTSSRDPRLRADPDYAAGSDTRTHPHYSSSPVPPSGPPLHTHHVATHRLGHGADIDVPSCMQGGPPAGYAGSAYGNTGTAPMGHSAATSGYSGAESHGMPPHGMIPHGSNPYMTPPRPNSRTGSTASGYSEDPLHVHTRTGTPTHESVTDVGTWRTVVTNMHTITAVDDKDKLDRALDNFAQTGTPFLGRFLMLSAAHRRVGGQGMVQFARGVHDGEEYAIKFFTQRSAFDREHELYGNPVLRSMMPAITHIEPNTDGSARSITGWPMPPCIVIERGESLDKWALRIKPDFTTILQVLTHVVTRLQRLHDNDLVHRDLKPGNVLWRPQHLEWTLIDFGCAAHTGAPPPPRHLPCMPASCTQ